MAVAFSYLDYEVRIFDGTPTTPNYITLGLVEDHNLPLAIPEAETTPFVGGGVLRPGNVVNIPTNEAAILAPVPFSFTFWLDPDRLWQLTALGNVLRESPWSIGAVSPVTWQPILPANMGSRLSSRDVAVPVPTPGSTHLLNHMFGLEARDENPPGATGSDHFVIRYEACIYTGGIEHQKVTDQPTKITFNGLCLGAITYPADFDATHVETT